MILSGDWRYHGRKDTYRLFTADYWPMTGLHPQIYIETKVGCWTDHLDGGLVMCFHKEKYR